MSGGGSERRKQQQTARPPPRSETHQPGQRQLQPLPGPVRTPPRWTFFNALERFVNEAMRNPVPQLINDFSRLNALSRPEQSHEFARNMDCNRYQDVICVEQNRVSLNNGRYIHANWISTFGEYRFICTQGPLPTTCDDFWTMIAQENIGCIVMLCDTIEQNRIKCHQYWPTAENPVMCFANGQITVRFNSEHRMREEDNLYKTELVVGAPHIRNDYLNVQQLHWRRWPDRGVPVNDLAPLRLLFHVQGIQRLVVHCSAGIGRTGTLVAVYLAYQTLQNG